MHYFYGILIGAGAVVVYDLVSGYSVADFLKDLYRRLLGEARSFAEARARRLEGLLAKVRSKIG